MNKSTIVSQVTTKVEEMEALLAELLLNPTLSENTKKTQKFQRQTAIHTLKVLIAIAKAEGDEVNFSMDEEKWFSSMVTLTSARKQAQLLPLHDGDSLIDILRDSGKSYEYVEKQCAKQGFRIDGMKIVKC